MSSRQASVIKHHSSRQTPFCCVDGTLFYWHSFLCTCTVHSTTNQSLSFPPVYSTRSVPAIIIPRLSRHFNVFIFLSFYVINKNMSRFVVFINKNTLSDITYNAVFMRSFIDALGHSLWSAGVHFPGRTNTHIRVCNCIRVGNPNS